MFNYFQFSFNWCQESKSSYAIIPAIHAKWRLFHRFLHGLRVLGKPERCQVTRSCLIAWDELGMVLQVIFLWKNSDGQNYQSTCDDCLQQLFRRLSSSTACGIIKQHKIASYTTWSCRSNSPKSHPPQLAKTLLLDLQGKLLLQLLLELLGQLLWKLALQLLRLLGHLLCSFPTLLKLLLNLRGPDSEGSSFTPGNAKKVSWGQAPQNKAESQISIRSEQVMGIVPWQTLFQQYRLSVAAWPRHIWCNCADCCCNFWDCCWYCCVCWLSCCACCEICWECCWSCWVCCCNCLGFRVDQTANS